jgi:group I intron endonuclease
MIHIKRKISNEPIIGIYQIKNNINGKIYIGKSIDIERRWCQHKYGKTKNVISLAISKYGITNFEFSIIEKVENIFEKNEIECRLIILEQKWMDINNSYKKGFGYNINKTSKPNLTSLRNKNFAEKISQIKIEMNHCGKLITQYSLTGEIIKEWKSAADIERTLGFHAENISASCLKKSKKSNNFLWRFKDDPITKDNIKDVDKIIRKRKKVVQLTKDNIQLKVFDSMSDAAKSVNSKYSSAIVHICKGNGNTYKGFKWKYVD